MKRSKLNQTRGFTLIELVISTVVMSIALGGVLMAINYTVTHSADPMLQHQAVAIAESYLEEILLKPFADPDDDGETSRVDFDDIDDYDGLNDEGAWDQTDTSIVGLGNYTVSVTVVDSDLNDITSASGDSKKITVTVSHPVGFNMTLSGYRTRY